MIRHVDQIDSIELPSEEDFRVDHFKDPKEIISENYFSASIQPKFKIDFNPYIKITRTNNYDIQRINDFSFSNDTNELIIGTNYEEFSGST